MASADSRHTDCKLREYLLDQLCLAIRGHAGVACRLNQFVGQFPGFAEAEANVREHWRTVMDLRADYDEHRREHGC